MLSSQCFKHGKIHTRVDFKTILGGVNTALAYTDGKPVERREIVTSTMTTLESLRAQAKASPELRKAIVDLLDEKSVDLKPEQVPPKKHDAT